MARRPVARPVPAPPPRPRAPSHAPPGSLSRLFALGAPPAGGRGLSPDARVRGQVESATGVSLDQARIHHGREVDRAAGAIHAPAFTVGRDIYLGSSAPAAGTRQGDRLLAHELIHVAQQGGRAPAWQAFGATSAPGDPAEREADAAADAALAGLPVGLSAAPPAGQILRGPPAPREGKYPVPQDPDLVYKGTTFKSGYTVLKPTKLNVKGPFSAQLLDLVSALYIDTSTSRGSAQAVLILKLLESSAEFVEVAKKLDDLYADPKGPDIRVLMGFFGSKYAGAGVPYVTSADRPASVDKDADTIVIDYSPQRMRSGDPTRMASEDEQIAVAFVQALVHEASHAYRRAVGKNKPGLSGFIEDELETRLKERSILSEISKGSTSKGIKAEAQDFIDQADAGTGSKRQVALSLVSGDGITYVESYYFDEALGLLYEKYRAAKPEELTGSAALTEPTAASADQALQDFDMYIVDQSQDREGLIDVDDDDRPGPRKPLIVKTTPAMIRRGELLLYDTLHATLTLKGIKDAAAKGGKLTTKESAIYYNLLLLKTYQLKSTIKDERANAGAPADDQDRLRVANQLAKKFLGLSKPYDAL